MDISRPCQPDKLIPLLPWPGFDPRFSGHNDRRAIISECTRLRLKPLSHRGWLFHYVLSMAMPNMKLIGEFVTQLEMPQAFWAFLYKMATRGHFVFPNDDKYHRVLVIWDLNGYGEYELNRCICDKVMACTSVGVRRRRRRRRRRQRRRNQKRNITEIFKFRGYNYVSCILF